MSALAFSDFDPRTRVVATLAMGVSTALVPIARWWALGAHALLVAVAIAAARPRARWLLTRLGLALAWGSALAATRVLAAPSPRVMEAAASGARVALALAATVPLAATTSLMQLVDALAGLRLPAAFVETTATTARGLMLLRAEAERLARARRLRAPDVGLRARVGLYGSLAATLVSRGLRRAERTHLAMTLRGFDGVPPPRPRTRTRDVLVLALLVLVLAAAHWLP